jgi:antitoxin PrlF
MQRSFYNLKISNTRGFIMASTVTSKGQVTIPKQIRDALELRPGSAVDFAVNREGEVVLHKIGGRHRRQMSNGEPMI